jgi:hypothetical protein
MMGAMVDAPHPSRVEATVEVVRGLVAELDPDGVTPSEAGRQWRAFDAIARLVGAAKMVLARRVEESPTWRNEGCRSAAEHLARVSGGSVHGAREALRASRKLRDIPVVEAALREGRLSVAQAQLIADAAAVAPDKQTELVEAAGRLSLAELAQECGRVKAAADPDPEATYRRIRANRRLRQRTDAEGAWCLHGRGTADDGALFQHVLEPLIDEIYDKARRDGRYEHRDTYAYDALVALLHRYLGTEEGTDSSSDHGDQEDANDDRDRGDQHAANPGGDAGPGANDDRDRGDWGAANPGGDAGPGDARGDAEPPPTTEPQIVPAATAAPSPPTFDDGRARRRPRAPGQPASGRMPTPSRRGKRKRSRVNPRYLALLRIDVAALQRGKALDGELCEIAGIGPVPVGVARRLLGDAVVKLVVTKGTDVVNVTGLGRGPTAAQRIALLWQSPSCSNEACARSFVQIDHRQPWAEAHETRLGNLDPLCPHCHRLKTHHNWALVDGSGKRPFVPPTDPRHPDEARHKRRAA